MNDDKQQSDNYTAGLALRRKMWGKAGADDHIDNASDMMAPVQDIVTRICFGEIWQRPGLNLKTRSLITLALLTAAGRTHEIKIHVRGALANGCTREELRELFVHAFAYCGIPLIVDAMRACEQVLAEIEETADKPVSASSSVERIGFIGLGNMGAPMSANLAKAGLPLTVFDLDPARCAAHAAKIGAVAASTLAELAAASDVIICMLPTGAIVRDVILGSSDAQSGVAAHLPAGALIIDMSSSVPTGTRELGATLASRGLLLMDAPVSGAVPRATDATLTLMVGTDDPAALQRARPVLGVLGKRIFETGKLGSGHAMKALNNYVAAAGFAAASEALIMADTFGLDRATALDILNESTGRNFSTQSTLKSQVLTHAWASGFGLELLTKDVGIAADLASSLGVDLPLVAHTSVWWREACDALGGTRDHTEAYRFRAEQAGIKS